MVEKDVYEKYIKAQKRKELLSTKIHYDNLEARKQTVKIWSDARLMAIEAWIIYVSVMN